MMTLLTDENKPRVVVFGSKNFCNQKLLFDKIEHYTRKFDKWIICQGGQQMSIKDHKSLVYVGADYLASVYFNNTIGENNICLMKVFHPDYQKHGSPAALHIRNREMIEYAAEEGKGYAIGFWDGKSPGTKSVIELCKKHKIKTKIVLPGPESFWSKK